MTDYRIAIPIYPGVDLIDVAAPVDVLSRVNQFWSGGTVGIELVAETIDPIVTGQKIALIAFPANGVTRLGNNLYALAGLPAPATGAIRQGFLEHSNVDLATSMTELITLQRSYQLSSRALSLQDQTIGEANDVGRVRG